MMFLFFYVFMWKLNQFAGFGLRGIPNDIFQSSLFAEIIKFIKFSYEFIDLNLVNLPELRLSELGVESEACIDLVKAQVFKEMQDELQQVQETQGDVVNSLVNLGFMGGIGAGFQGGAGRVAQKGVKGAKGILSGNPLSLLGMGGGF